MNSESNDLSSILGWVSIACWIVVYSPQIYTNYQLKSGDGLSVGFVIVWLVGDLCNLFGAMWGGLLTTVIILASYYSLCDIILLYQIYYYRWISRRQIHGTTEDHGEDTPLLDGSTREPKKTQTTIAVLARYTAALIFVIITGVAAWWISRQTRHDEVPAPPAESLRWEIQVLGWSSAVLYLAARIPQIIKNFKTRCDGLAPALFVFAIAGNITYAWSILAASMDRDYLINNASWLAGSSLTVFLDIIVLSQFFYYRAVEQGNLDHGSIEAS